jgi:hypothetical protein
MVRKLAALFSILLLAACGGGGGGGDSAPPAPPPSGVWFGALEDPDSVMKTFEVTTSGLAITQIRINGTPTGQTGTLTPRSGNIFSFLLNDGTDGGFFLDAARTHAAFVDELFSFGVLQLNAASLPTFVHTDLNGSWSGQAITMAANFATFTAVASSATCSVPTCTVTDPGGTTTATFSSDNFTSNLVNEFGQPTGTGTQWGRWPGTHVSNSAPIAPSGSMRAFLSADKTFAATWACNPSSALPNCKFNSWNKL